MAFATCYYGFLRFSCNHSNLAFAYMLLWFFFKGFHVVIVVTIPSYHSGCQQLAAVSGRGGDWKILLPLLTPHLPKDAWAMGSEWD